MSCMSRNSTRVVFWWILVLAGAGIALLITWATRVVHVPPVTLLAIGAVIIALSWLAVLVSLPWNLYFGACRVLQEAAASRDRGIAVRPASDAEARRISRRMLWLALGGHLSTAVAAAAIAFFSGNKTGYYIAGLFLLSTAFRPASAYLSHVRERISVLTRQSTHPREDVATLRTELAGITRSLDDLRAGMQRTGEDLRRAEARLSDAMAHDRGLLTADLGRVKEAQEADRARAASRDDDLERRISQMVRSVESTLDGISDHGVLVAGLHALVRMIRAQQA
jgi:hypothetical protein